MLEAGVAPDLNVSVADLQAKVAKRKLEDPYLGDDPTRKIQSSGANHSTSGFQDVRVDNWSKFCLQRLQTMYERGDFCDLTLQFKNHQTLKVRVICIMGHLLL
jgi:hypothetical protein